MAALFLFVFCAWQGQARADGWAIFSAKAEYWRYEFVELAVLERGSGVSGKDVPLLAVKIKKDGQDAASFGGREILPLFYDPATRSWRGKWPLFWNIRPGIYNAVLLRPDAGAPESEIYGGPGGNFMARFDNHNEAASVAFKIQARQPMDLPPGFCAMTLEPGRATYNAFPGVNGEKPSWFRLLEWARFMHADAFWHNAGITHVRGHLDKKRFPWDPSHIAMAKLIAPEAKSQSLAYGAYLVTFRVEGEYEKAPYTFTTSYDHACDLLAHPRFVSLTDTRRQQDLVQLLKELDSVEGISWLGLDYVRSNNGGLEMVDEFLSDMGFLVPQELKAGSLESRQLWLGRILVKNQDLKLEGLWNWFKAHKTCEVIHGVLERAQVKKPVWMFLLGWKQGHQHGQDPFMFVDAGISLVAPMFYELNPVEFEKMIKDWQAYLKRGSGTFVFGQPVDSPLLHNSKNLNGPEELYRRQMEALEQFKGLTDRMGFFWHDLNRALAGGRGPEPMREWVIAGASTFSRLREAAGLVPVHVEILDGATLSLDGIAFRVKVSNLQDQEIRLLRMDGLRTPGMNDYQPASLDVLNLKAFESRELDWKVLWGDRQVKEKYQDLAPEIRMLALRARVPNSEMWKQPDFAFNYVGERWAPSEPAPLSTTAVIQDCCVSPQ
jgi:hypothetical protein